MSENKKLMVCTPVHSSVSVFYTKACLDLQKKFISVDGDKSLSIRFVLLASLSNGKSIAQNLLKSEVDVEIVSEHTKEFDSVIVSSGFYNFIVNETDTYKSRFSFVFIKTDSDWKILSHHSSVIPESH